MFLSGNLKEQITMKLPSVNIAILNYNGKKLLEECLPSILRAADRYPGKCGVTVVDNKSTDDSIAFLKKKYGKKVSLHVASENRVLVSYNEYIKSLKDEIVIILNNDMKLDAGFIEPLVGYFKKTDTFFVSPKHMDFEGKEYQGGKNKIIRKLGFVSAGPFYKNYENDLEKPSLNLFTGNGAFSVKIFNKIGGFDSLFLPGGMEDTDICVRGWKAGYKGYYEPESVLYHKGSATFKKEFGNTERMINNYKNSFLFYWKNMSAAAAAAGILIMPLTLLIMFFTGRFFHIGGFFKALKSAGRIKKTAAISDKFTFSQVEKLTSSGVLFETYGRTKKELSIVIPTYNRQKDLLALLDSLFIQKYDRKKVEIIVSDDGSSDGTGEAIKRLLKKHPELKYVYQKNSGPSAARNNGIRAAAGKIIGFIDSDVIADKNLIKNALKVFKHSKADVIEGMTLSLERDIKNTVFTHTVQNKTGKRWITCNLFARREIIEKIGGFDEEFRHPIREDTALGFAMLKAGAVSDFSEKITVYHPVYKSNYRMLFKLAFYGVYEPLLIKKFPVYYFKYLNWFDSWFVPSYYSGYYVMVLFAAVWFLTGNNVFAYAAAGFYALSYIVSVYAMFRKKTVVFKDIITVGFHYLYIPYLRLYWITAGIFKYFIKPVFVSK